MKKKRYPKSTAPWRFAFVVYVALMLWLLFARDVGWDSSVSYAQQLRENMNLVPFRTLSKYYQVVCQGREHSLFVHCLINLLGNVVLFIPAGYLMPRLFPLLRNFFCFMLACLLAISLVELLQLVTLLGSLDIDDLILNLFGMLLGYLGFMLLRK